MEPRITAGGDVDGGWLVDIHDGDRHGVYRPEAETAEEAREKALAEHNGVAQPQLGQNTGATITDQPKQTPANDTDPPAA
jgi:hypothetical protein